MSALARGDRNKFDAVYEALWPCLHAFATKLLGGDPGDGADAAQQALLRVFTQASHYDQQRDALSWAFTITWWECRTTRRQRSRRREVGLAAIWAAVCPRPPPDEQIERDEVAVALSDAFAELSETDRLALAGEVINGSVKPVTLRKRKQRAMLRLRAAMRTRYGAD